MNLRRAIVSLLIFAGVLTGVLATLAVYVRDALVDSDEAAERAAVALAEPGVRELIGREVVRQVVAASPDALAARPLLEQVVAAAIASPAFRPIYEAAIRDLHQTVLYGRLDTLTIQLTDMVLIVQAQAAALSPDLSAQIPGDLTDTLIEVQSHPLLADAAQLSGDIRLLAFLLPLLSLAAFGGLILLSEDRRQGWTRAGAGVIAIGFVVLVCSEAADRFVPLMFEEGAPRDVASAFWGAYAGDLSVWGFVITSAGAMMLAALWWMAEPSDAVARLAQFRRFMLPPANTLSRLLWIAAWLLVGGLMIFNWQGAVRAIAAVVGAVLVVNAMAELLRMIAPEGIGAPRGQGGAPVFSFLRPSIQTVLTFAAAFLALAAVIAGGYFAIERSGGGGGPFQGRAGAAFTADFDPACNGHVLLCDRRLDNIVIAATHNSMSSAEDGFVLANHSRGIIPQLDAGYRGLLIDLHYGITSQRSQVVVTDIAPLAPHDREALAARLGEAAVASAEELRRRNLEAGGVRDIYMCHSLCEIGATLLSAELGRIRAWLEQNPREVLVIIIQDHVTPRDVADAFDSAGLARYTHAQDPAAAWPTLLQMIDSGRRLVVMAEKDNGGLPWYHDAFTFVQETPYTFETAADFNCRPNRGLPDSPLFMINHWITPALAGAGAAANSTAVLEQRLHECRERQRPLPNILAVDFYAQGDALSVAAQLNGIPPSPEPQETPSEGTPQDSSGG